MNRRLHDLARLRMAEKNAPIVGTLRRQFRIGTDRADVFAHVGWSSPRNNVIGNFMKTLASPRGRRTDLAGIKHGMVVLRVADPDAVVQREPECFKNLAQAGRLADALW